METMAHSHVPPELPGYEIERRIGSGGNATVWLARQLSLDRVVAIKILAPKLLRDPEAREQFQQEARAAARISHAAIVGILDFGEHDGLLYYVMEYVAGTNLAEWLHVNQRMAHTQALKLVEIVATALNQVWRDAGLIHCDIKPGNILLGEDGAVKITDLGLARIAGAAATREPSACIEGTPTYIAPEQIEGYLPDIRTDIYSLGLTFYHMLTGTPPFEGYSLDEIIEAQQTDYLPDPCEVLPHLPVSYGWLLAKMTAKNPAKRPASWDEVLKDIQQIKSGKSPLPPYPAEDESTILLSPRHRPAARANTINLSAAAKKAITLTASPDMLISQQKRGSVAQSVSSGGGGCLRFFFFLLFLAALGGAGWFFGLRGHPERVEQIKAAFTGKPKRPPSSGIPDIPIRSAPADADAAAQAVVEESSAPAVSDELEKPLVLSAGSPSATPGAWNHPGFIQAANLFNQALTNYQAHLKAPETAQVSLVGIISDAQYAAVLFETIRPDAPADVPVTLYANQCYQLVNDARRARLTQEDKQNLFSLAPKTPRKTCALSHAGGCSRHVCRPLHAIRLRLGHAARARGQAGNIGICLSAQHRGRAQPRHPRPRQPVHSRPAQMADALYQRLQTDWRGPAQPARSRGRHPLPIRRLFHAHLRGRTLRPRRPRPARVPEYPPDYRQRRPACRRATGG